MRWQRSPQREGGRPRGTHHKRTRAGHRAGDASHRVCGAYDKLQEGIGGDGLPLLHHVTPELHRASYWELNHKAVPGIDGGTWTEYRKPLVARREELHKRVQRGTY